MSRTAVIKFKYSFPFVRYCHLSRVRAPELSRLPGNQAAHETDACDYYHTQTYVGLKSNCLLHFFVSRR
jgi:hypothetical protein